MVLTIFQDFEAIFDTFVVIFRLKTIKNEFLVFEIGRGSDFQSLNSKKLWIISVDMQKLGQQSL